jgi:hypothetical protein
MTASLAMPHGIQRSAVRSSMAQETAQTEQRPSRGARWRLVASITLLVLACLLAMTAVVTLWARGLVLNTDRFVDATTSLIEKPAIQEALANRITQRLMERTDPEAAIKQALPDRAGFLAGTLAGTLERFIHDVALNVVSSDAFRNTWEALMRAVHPQVVALLRGEPVAGVTAEDGTITIDLGPVMARVAERLEARGVNLFGGVQQDADQPKLVLFESDELASAQNVVKWLDRAAWFLPIAALAFAAGSVLLARTVMTGLLRVGIGFAVSMLVLLLLSGIARNRYLASLDENVSRGAASELFDAVVSSLQVISVLLILAGILVAVVAGVAAVVGPRIRAPKAPSSAEQGAGGAV